MEYVKLYEDFHNESTNSKMSLEAISENVYPKGKGGPIENSLRSEEVGRLNLKHNGEIIGTLLVWTRPGYLFVRHRGGGDPRINTRPEANSWECGASYTSYPMSSGGRFGDGSTGTGVWEGPSGLSKDDSIKACKDFMKNVKLS